MLAVLITFSATSCFGTFQLTRNVYSWNESVSDNKFVRSLVFWGMTIIPVYSVVVGLDAIIFNLIEFWGGSNPISMAPGEEETETLSYEGVEYEVKASQNRFDIQPLDGSEPFALVFNADNSSWNIENGDENREIVRLLTQGTTSYVQVYDENGMPHLFNMNQNYATGDIIEEMSCSQVAIAN